MKRNPTIDILRFIGLSLLILAHVGSPFTIHQIRTFDVPLMVFISGLSYGNKEIDNIRSFYWKRIKRLLIPVWTFILIYMLPLFILQASGLLRAGLTWSGFWGSFVFYGEGMGYIWIFKVFIIVMICTPFLIKINKKIDNNWLYMGIILLIVGIQQLLCFLMSNNPDIPCKGLINTYGLYILGYLPLFMLGLRVRDASFSSELIILVPFGILITVALFAYIRLHGFPINIDEYKYPPQVYYILYGCFMSILLWCLRNPITHILNNRYVLYIGENSDWIYLWHAFFVLYVSFFVKQWYLRFIIIYALALMMCVLQKKVVAKSNSSFIKKYY